VADALSRAKHFMAVDIMSEAEPAWIQEVTNCYATDCKAQKLLQQLTLHSPNDQDLSLNHGLIKRGNQIWIANNSVLRTKLITLFHSSALGGHPRVQGTYMMLKKQFYWKDQKQDVYAFVKHCQIC
jgi:hypothetical protein